MSDTAAWLARKLAQQKANAPAKPASHPPVNNPGPEYGRNVIARQQMQPGVKPHFDSLGEALASGYVPENSQAVKQELDRCPNCGSNNFFSRRAESKYTERGMASPSPHCFDCGYKSNLGNQLAAG